MCRYMQTSLCIHIAHKIIHNSCIHVLFSSLRVSPKPVVFKSPAFRLSPRMQQTRIGSRCESICFVKKAWQNNPSPDTVKKRSSRLVNFGRVNLQLNMLASPARSMCRVTMGLLFFLFSVYEIATHDEADDTRTTNHPHRLHNVAKTSSRRGSTCLVEKTYQNSPSPEKVNKATSGSYMLGRANVLASLV